MNHFLYSLESVGPLVVLVLIGYILRRKEIIGKAFIDTGTSLVFKLSLPVLLFNQISKRISKPFSIPISFCLP